MGVVSRSFALAATLAAAFGLVLAAPAAGAASTVVQLRIEGKTQTLFEGPLASQGHAVQASSDSQPRSCNGVNPNDPENVLPGATPTAAAVDAMALLGESFDGRWYEGLDDYLISRWGPQRAAEGESWFLLVNHMLSNVGGCQLELHEGADVLWAYELSPSKSLALYPAGGAPGAPPLTATATLGAPFALEVSSRSVKEGRPPVAPESAGFVPYSGAAIAPVQTSAQSFETVEGASPAVVKTNAEGRASVTFTEPGWHRLKASASAFGVVRSNRLDVCVPAVGASDCGPPPVDDLLRPSSSGQSVETTLPGGARTPQPGVGAQSTPSRPSSTGGVLGARELRIDGLVLEPLGAHAAALHYRGRWRFVPDRRAWHGVVALGRAGAMLSVRLGAGRPAFIVRDVRRRALVRISAAGHSTTFAVTASSATRLLIAARRARAGSVRLRVLAGTVGIDGVALAR
jgi:hypothetical protein